MAATGYRTAADSGNHNNSCNVINSISQCFTVQVLRRVPFKALKNNNQLPDKCSI